MSKPRVTTDELFSWLDAAAKAERIAARKDVSRQLQDQGVEADVADMMAALYVQLYLESVTNFVLYGDISPPSEVLQ